MDADQPAMVRLDLERFEFAADALIENAVKLTDPTDVIRLACDVVDGWCVVEVSDSGKDLHPSDIPFLFERFWKKAQPGSPSGNGLGLSVVRAIVDAHRGEVSAQPRPGGGATFTVRLPLLPVPHVDERAEVSA